MNKFTSSFSKGMLGSTILLSLIIIGSLVYIVFDLVKTNTGDVRLCIQIGVFLVLAAAYLYMNVRKFPINRFYV